MDGLAAAKAHLELVRDDDGTDHSTVTAGRALVLIDIAGLFADTNPEIPDIAAHILDL